MWIALYYTSFATIPLSKGFDMGPTALDSIPLRTPALELHAQRDIEPAVDIHGLAELLAFVLGLQRPASGGWRGEEDRAVDYFLDRFVALVIDQRDFYAGQLFVGALAAEGELHLIALRNPGHGFALERIHTAVDVVDAGFVMHL